MAFGSKGIDLLRIKIDFQGRKKLGGIGNVALPFHYLPQPGEPLLVLRRYRAIFVFPMRSDALFGYLVHLLGPDLHFKGGAFLRYHGGVQRLIKIWPRHSDEIFNATGHRPPQIVNDPQYGIAVLY